MSDKCMDRQRRTGVLLQTLLCWTLVGLCCAGHRPRERGERTRHTRHHDRWSQGIQYPSLHGQGTQRIEYPSMNDEGSRYPLVATPFVNDSGASSQIQKCAPGYYRDSSGLFLGRCVPCECNGLADECEERTGRCLSCQYNTAGDRCERCKEGYYGNAAQRTCRVCPCPFSLPANNFAMGCKEVFGDFECICRAGYSGDKCESCAPGYYGDPLIPGGSCRPCNCYGNGKNCDRRTGVCKNTLEPGDTNTDGHCQECDNCAQTLLNDLEKLDDELRRIKTQMDNATASATSQERLKKLEKAVSDTKILVKKLSSAVNTQKSRVNQLEDDVSTLTDDISTLKDKAAKRADDADKAVSDVGKTHKRAKDLDSEIQNMLKKIQALLDQLKDEGTGGTAVPNENLSKMLEDAQSMVKEMENRNFTPQKTAAEKERDEAMKLLDYVKANVSKQSDQNEVAAEKLRGLLKGYEAKLKDLDKALKEAVDLLKKANAQNGLNAQTLEDLQKRVKDLKQERKTVEDQMTMAETELQKTEDLAEMLSDSKTEYEQLAAQMDGAKTDLTKKVNEIANAAAKKGLVEAAEEHAKTLNKLAKELENAVKNASGRPEVRNAKDAIDAYKNITDAVNAAEAAANEAKGAADNALNNVKKQKLTQRATELKETSDDLLNNAKDAEKDLQVTAADVTDLKKRLKAAGNKKNALEKDLLDVLNQLNNNNNRDDISDMIDDAKRKAASANNTATNTMDRLNDIRKEIGNFSVNPVDSNLGNVLDEVDQSVKKLLKTIPSLNDKLSEVEKLTSQFSTLNNISDNIKKMKELIEQARDAANRVVIPVKFMGGGYVEMRAPKNLEDLKAYTSLSLSLQRPEGRGDGRRRRRQTSSEGDMFVLYLGNRDSSKNYIGLVLKANVLYGVYKLNGVEYTIESGSISKSSSEPAKFDRVELQRIYQDVQLNLTKDITGNTPSTPILKTKQGDLSKNLLDLSPSDVVFYVGGYPDTFVPPASLKYPKYKGCIEFSSFNDKVVSLYNFQKAEGINVEVPCKRYVRPLDSSYYEGTGHGRVVIDKPSSVFLVKFYVYSRSENGLLLLIDSEENYFTVTIEKGFIVLRSNLQDAPAISTEKKFPISDWAELLIVRVASGKMRVRLSNEEAVSAQTTYDNQAIKGFYIGGAPQDIRDRYNITILPFKGCLKNMKVNSENFKPVIDAVGISKGCPTNSLVTRKAEFSLESSLKSKSFSLANQVTVSLGFKSTENEGLILQEQQPGHELELALENGHVVLSFNKIWKSSKTYNDGQWHYLTITKRGESVTVVIDDEDTGQELISSVSKPTITGDTFSLGKDTFKGCIANFYTRRSDNLYMPEDFSTFQSSGDVLLDVCTADTFPQLMLDRPFKKDVVMQAINETLSTCALPALIQNAYRMGGPVSSLSYSFPLQVLRPRPHFSLDVRTRAPEGLLFFAATRGGRSHLVLYISKGRIRLSVGKQKEIFNREKYNDGKWHSVIFSLEKKKFRLVVDGIRAQDGQLTNAEFTSMQQFVSPVYLGSAPESLHRELKLKALPKQSVSGCIRNFKMNGAPMSNPTTNHGAGPCFDGQTQRGAYFSGNGSHVILNDSFIVGSSFELLFNIRPRSPTGLLLHVGDSSWNQYGPAMGHYLTVYMLRGEVVAQANNGKGEFRVSVKPKVSLCDGMFHKISVIKRKNVVQLHVDTMDHYKIGPPSSTITLTKDSLYVGGIPEMAMQQALPVTSSFVGCIQDMRINSDSVSFDRPSGVFGPVNLKECPG